MSVLSHIIPKKRLLFVDPWKLSNYNVSKSRVPPAHWRAVISRENGYLVQITTQFLNKISEKMLDVSRLSFLRDKAEFSVGRHTAFTHKVPMGAF
jgi:hypothetical protein